MDVPYTARYGARYGDDTYDRGNYDDEPKSRNSFVNKAADVAFWVIDLVTDTYHFIPVVTSEFICEKIDAKRDVKPVIQTTCLVASAVLFNLATIPLGTAGIALRLATTAMLVFGMLNNDHDRSLESSGSLLGQIPSNFVISWVAIKLAKVHGASVPALLLHLAVVVTAGVAATVFSKS